MHIQGLAKPYSLGVVINLTDLLRSTQTSGRMLPYWTSYTPVHLDASSLVSFQHIKEHPWFLDVSLEILLQLRLPPESP
jgi:hypothetical protein